MTSISVGRAAVLPSIFARHQGHPQDIATSSVGLSRRLQQLPDSLAAVAVPPKWQPALQAGVGGMTRLLYAASMNECAQLISHSAAISVLVTIPEHLHHPLVEDCSRLQANFQQTPFVGFFLTESSDVRALASIAAGGMRHVLLSDHLHNSEHCYSVLAASETWSVASRVWRQSKIAATDAVATLMLAALRLAHEPISMARLALAARMHERTLRKYCARHGLPSPQWLIGWARCLVAAYYLEERGRTIQSIAGLLQYNSGVLLANHLKRYCGITASELRRRGPLATAARVFEGFLATSDLRMTSSDPVMAARE